MTRGIILASAAAGLFLAAAADDGPFVFPENDLTKAAPRAVFVAAMGNYRTREISGEWGAWGDKGEGGKPHQPDTQGAYGKRDIASAWYPAIGPYDMSDPTVAEYHCQLLKMAGIDGISFNLAQFERDTWRQKSMRNYVQSLRRYGLHGIVRFENKFYARTYPDPKEALAAAYRDMDAWLDLLDPVAYRIAGRPVFMLFTFKLSPGELRAWQDRHAAAHRPLILVYSPKAEYQGIAEGMFGWTGDAPNRHTDRAPYVRYVDPEQVVANERWDRERALRLLTDGRISFYMGSVSPGFDDIGCWGWGNGPRKVERQNGDTYRFRWEKMIATNLRTVLIPTWNDWNEGTVIEPAQEFGEQYLAITRHYAAQFKRAPEPKGNLQTPLRIYQLRKRVKDPAAQRLADRASEAIAAGRFADADALVH